MSNNRESFEAEYLSDREIEARAARGINPWLSAEITDDLAHRKALVRYYQNMRDRLIELCGKNTWELNNFVFTAGDLWKREIEGYFELGYQSLFKFRQNLIARGLLTGAAKDMALKMNLNFVDPELQARQRAEQEETEKINTAMQQILAACENRQTALNVYNCMGEGGRSFEKLDRWVSLLVQAKQLDISWLPGRRTGGLVEWLKSLIPGKQNKSLDPRTSNKSR